MSADSVRPSVQRPGFVLLPFPVRSCTGQLETTDLEDEVQTFVPGVQTMEAMEFTANYTLEAYTAVKAKSMSKRGQ